ncbi:hypothetical protein [Candidatus Nitrosotalea okcheonensis]|uniref:Uncharacterized protein n=1 Tax=Candidatus Nitrosotalea okcheonensis TaxID=1903276 RepID=A0A2H1FE93_9ARCH|nr:hypothetical protein [Candidatus Nitrosotalea okcheonensis]SMH71102.1 conserved protein of unknown function [Candidatus Nitrosotalea okcheonensis]
MECKSETGDTEDATCSCTSEMECGDCGCGTADPVKQSTELLHKAFHDALYQAHVERLKKRIDSSFGPSLDKATDAMIETASKVWQSMLVQSEAKKELESKLQKIFSETSRR